MATWGEEKSHLHEPAADFRTRFQRTLSDHVFGDELRRMDQMAHGPDNIRLSAVDVPEEIRLLRQKLMKDDFLVSQDTPTSKGYHGPDGDDESKDIPDFPRAPEEGLTTSQANILMQKWGRNALEEKETPAWLAFALLLIEPMPVMLWIAAFVEMGIQNWPDAGILLGIQFANAGISFYETTKSGNAVAALKNSLKPTCVCKRDGVWQNKFDGTMLVPGDLVQLYQGGAVPADVWINEGELDIDQSAMTGESLPVTMYEGDIAKMGSVVARGEVEATVQSTGMNTFFGKTASLLQVEKSRSNLDTLLLRIMIVLVALSFLLCTIVFIRLLQIEHNLKEAISFTVVLIVASIPLAMEIVTTTTLAVGSKEMSKFGAIVSRLGAIEDLAGMNILCSDKTGTLTKNKMEIQPESPTFYKDMDQSELLRYAAMAAKWQDAPKDALDTLVLGPQGADLDSLGAVTQIDYMPFDPRVKRTASTIKINKTGEVFKVTKGAPNVLLKLCKDREVERKVNHIVSQLAGDGVRSLAVARTIDGTENWVMLGLITFLDPPRDDTKETVRRSLEYGVPVRMITGDHVNIARKTARDLGLPNANNIKGPDELPVLIDGKAPDNMLENYGHVIRAASGFASVFPEHKYLIVEIYRLMGFKVGMTGDGVNDAPALKRADVGVAVQGATDAANAASDIVLTREGLSTIVEGMVIARCIFQRMKNFLVYRIAATLQLLVFFFIAVLFLRPRMYADTACGERLPAGTDGETVLVCAGGYGMTAEIYREFPSAFHMPVLLLMLITLLNDGTLIAIGYDTVTPSPRPEVWNLPVLFLISSLLAGVALASSLWLLYESLNSWHPEAFLHSFDIHNLTYGQITMMIYLKVSISDFLTLFSARAGDDFFWTSKPAPILFWGGVGSLSISTIIATSFPVGHIDGIAVAGLGQESPKGLAVFVWLYCLLWFVIQDLAKVATYKWLMAYNIFDIKGDKDRAAFKAVLNESANDDYGMPAHGHSEMDERRGSSWKKGGAETLSTPLLSDS